MSVDPSIRPEPLAPAPPWRLCGSAVVTVWLAPTGTSSLPGLRPLRLDGRQVVVGAWAEYGPGSTVEYREVLLATPAWDRFGPLATVTWAWVDAPVSVQVGRDHWGVPKRLGDFGPGRRLLDESRVVAELELGRPSSASARLPLRGRLAQALGGRLLTAPFVGRARVAPVRARWSAPLGSPFAALADQPALSFQLTDLAVRVGRAAP